MIFTDDDALGVPPDVVPGIANVGVIALGSAVDGIKLVGGNVTGDAGTGVAGAAGCEDAASSDILFLASRNGRDKSAFLRIAHHVPCKPYRTSSSISLPRPLQH